MTIVELPENSKETWIGAESDGRTVMRVWGTATDITAMEQGRWHITIEHNDSIVGFIYADAIRRK